jgi:hypothetical protein
LTETAVIALQAEAERSVWPGICAVNPLTSHGQPGADADARYRERYG